MIQSHTTTFAGMSATQRQLVRTVLTVMLLLLLVSSNVWAQTVSAETGATTWTALKSIWFGYPGLVLGLLIFGLSIYFFVAKGFLAALGIVCVGIFFFFLPALVMAIQGIAKTA